MKCNQVSAVYVCQSICLGVSNAYLLSVCPCFCFCSLGNSSITSWCHNHLVSLMCQHFFPLCGNMSLYHPTQEYCDYVINVACSAEMHHPNFSKYLKLISLLVCNNLPNQPLGIYIYIYIHFSH